MSDSIALGATLRHDSSGAVDDTPTATLVADRYEVLGLVGRGGMGAVYRALDRTLDETVALKMLRRELLGSADAVSRFVQEVKLARKVTHPNVARTFDIGEHGADRFLTMEWIDGESLGARIAREGRLSRGETLRIALAICDGVEAAHSAAVVHRDLKPDNVMLARDGRVVVTDFGIARASTGAERTGGIAGTPAYMAPEQIEGGKLDARTDVYAIGEILYELLTGERAWSGDNPYLVALAKMRDGGPDPRAKADVSPELGALAQRCMARAPGDRYPDVSSLRAGLRGITALDSAPSIVAVAPRRETRAALSLAVRPFRSAIAGDPDDLARGLAEDVLDTLSTAPGLRVRGAPDSDLDSRSLGRELSVDVVLEGTLRRVGDEVRFSARVIGVADGFHVWARRFVAPHAELLSVADDAANAIAEALAAHVSSPRRSAVDSVALDCYLRGRDLMRRSWYTVGAEASGAMALFEEALSRAPEEPTFLATAAVAHTRSPRSAGRNELATERARRAIALAPHLPEPWLALAQVQSAAGDAVGAIAPGAEAHRKGPSLSGPLAFLGGLFEEIGPPEVARRYLDRATESDPSSGPVLVPLLRTLYFLGEYDEIRRRVASSTDVHNFPIVGALCTRFSIWSGDASWLPVTGFDKITSWPLTALLGDVVEHKAVRAQTLAGLAALRPRGTRFWRFACQLAAETLAATRDPQAFEWLQASLDVGFHDIVWLDRCPSLAFMRDDARFAAMRTVAQGRAEVLRAALAREGHP